MSSTYTTGKKSAPSGDAKRQYRRRRNRKITSKKGATAQSKQIVALNKRIDAMQDNSPPMRLGLAHQHYNNALTNDVISLVPAYASGTLTGQGNWIGWGTNIDQIDSSPSDIASRQRCRVGRIYNRIQFTAGTEHSPCNYNVYHVKLRPERAEEVVADLGRNLAGLKTLATTHNKYFARGTYDTHNLASQGGSVVLNRDLFDVKQEWNFVLGNTIGMGEGVNYNVSSITSAIKNISFSFPTNYVMGNKDDLPWKNATPDSVPVEHLNFILIFTDNGSSVDGSPSVRSLSTTHFTCLDD